PASQRVQPGAALRWSAGQPPLCSTDHAALRDTAVATLKDSPDPVYAVTFAPWQVGDVSPGGRPLIRAFPDGRPLGLGYNPRSRSYPRYRRTEPPRLFPPRTPPRWQGKTSVPRNFFLRKVGAFVALAGGRETTPKCSCGRNEDLILNDLT